MEELGFVRKGPLLKRGKGKLGKISKWKPKMVVLTADGAFMFCDSGDKVLSQPDAIGHIDLRQSEIELSDKRKFSFVIKSHKASSFFQAPSADACLQWFEDIQLVIERCNEGKTKRTTVFQPFRPLAPPSLATVSSAMPIEISYDGMEFQMTENSYQQKRSRFATEAPKPATSHSGGIGRLGGKPISKPVVRNDDENAGSSDDELDADGGAADLLLYKQVLSMPSQRGSSYDSLASRASPPLSETLSTSSSSAGSVASASSSAYTLPPPPASVNNAYDYFAPPRIVSNPRPVIQTTQLTTAELSLLNELMGDSVVIPFDQSYAAPPPSPPPTLNPAESAPMTPSENEKAQALAWNRRRAGEAVGRNPPKPSDYSAPPPPTTIVTPTPVVPARVVAHSDPGSPLVTSPPATQWTKSTPSGPGTRRTVELGPRSASVGDETVSAGETISVGAGARTIDSYAAKPPMNKSSFAFVHFSFSPYASPVIMNGQPVR